MSHTICSRYRRLVAASVLALSAGTASAQGPTVDLWYGDTQTFGDKGNPQTWVNVLGNASDPDGVASLVYTLNGGPPQPLNMGPDTRRLLEPGDFNVEIDYTTLIDGLNTVVITATDTLSNVTNETVTVDYHAGNTWPTTWTADWSAATAIADVAQVVDGKWRIEPDGTGIRPLVLGYDRTFVIGDVTWADFETTMPITIHAIDPGGFMPPSTAPGIGVTNRWTGHTTLVPGEQPHAYWLPQGGGGWYDFEDEILWLAGSDGLFLLDPSGKMLNFGQTYRWKVRSETLPNGDTFYGFKLWDDGLPEPVDWFLYGTEGPVDLQNGSLLVVAHHVDATFGNIEIVDLASDVDAPAILDVQLVVGNTTATISWHTNEPATSEVAYGETLAYELGAVVESDLVSDHSIDLLDLTPGVTHYFEITSTDGRGNGGTETGSFTTDSGPPPSTLVSDDFSSPTLDTNTWTFVDPLADSSIALNGGQLLIQPDPAALHDAWDQGANVPRVMQAHDDGDFEVEVKFESDVTVDFQSQGILVEGSASDFVRAEFHNTGSGVTLFVAYVVGTTPTALITQPLGIGAPHWLRLRREGADWTVSWSDDGLTWTIAGNFAQLMVTTAIGPFAGNATGVAHEAVVDYFFNNASPIDPEDGNLVTLDVGVIGSGAVVKDPDLVGFFVGENVDVTAVPDPGWIFSEWQGDLAGSPNPVSLTMTADVNATAVFAFQSDVEPPVISGISVQADQDAARVTWQTDEPASSQIDFGETPAYELGTVGDPAFKTSHELFLSGLTAGTTIHYEITSEDPSANPGSTGDLTFATPVDAGPTGIQSDDFSKVGLDESLWTYVNPYDDATLVFDGTRMQIDVPTGFEHEVWTDGNFLPRIMQPVVDGDFELEVRFESTPDTSFQSQGLLIQDDPDDFVRAEWHYLQGKLRIYVVTFTNNVPSIKTLTQLTEPAMPYAQPTWLRVNRTGDQWTVDYSFDGIAWTQAVTWSESFVITEVGVFAGNSDDTPNLATVDYFFSNALPVVPEDDDPSELVVNVVGNGSVLRDPDQLKYDTGESVDLTPVPDAGWAFTGWSGDATGTTVPLEVVVGTGTEVTATFIPSTGGPQITSLSPSTIEPVQPGTAQTVTINGVDFTPSTTLLIDGVAPDPVLAPYTVVSDTEIALAWPLVSKLGQVDVTVVDPSGSDTAQMTVVAHTEGVLEIEHGDEPVAVFSPTMNVTVAAPIGDYFFLTASWQKIPTVVPGIVALDIGNQAQTLFYLGNRQIPAKGWDQIEVPIPIIFDTTAYLQGALACPLCPPYPVSNVQELIANQ